MPKHIPEPTPEPIEYSEGYDGPRFLPLEKHAGPPDYRAATHTWGGEPIEGTVSIIGPENFELTLTDGMHRAIQERGFGRTRKEFEDLIFRILADPHGETNIDEFKDETAGQVARLVHEVTGPLAELVPGKRLAIKSTGLDMHHTREYLEAGGSSRTLLTNQFRETLELWRKQQQYAPEGVGGIIFVNEVYGIVSYTDDRGGRQEWMLMEYVPDAKAVTNIELVKIGGGFIPAFSIEQYPELAQLTGIDPRLDADKTHIRFEELQKVIEEALHDWSRKSAIADLNGNNILEQRDENGRVRYTLIDIASHQ